MSQSSTPFIKPRRRQRLTRLHREGSISVNRRPDCRRHPHRRRPDYRRRAEGVYENAESSDHAVGIPGKGHDEKDAEDSEGRDEDGEDGEKKDGSGEEGEGGGG